MIGKVLNYLTIFIVTINLSRNFQIKILEDNFYTNIINNINIQNCSIYNRSDCNFCGPGKIFNNSKLFISNL